MDRIVYRKNKLFCINKSLLKPEARKDDVCIALYAAIYTEFSGAVYNTDYKDITPIERLDAINAFAENWLDERGLL